jgi:predicted dehydrogenase
MTEALRYGFLGCGMMGQEHLRNLHLIPGSEVVAIVETDDEMWQKASVLAPKAERVASLEALLDGYADQIDALIITTPNYQHAEQLQYIAANSSVSILTEKPICTELHQVKILQNVLEKHPAPVWVGMEYRYMPPIAELLSRCHAGDLGALKLLAIREHRFPFLTKVGDWNRFNKNTGGTLVEKCCHFFDLMRLIVQSDATRVYASGGVDVNHRDEKYGGQTPDILDNALVIVDFENGKRAMLELCMFAEGSRFQEQISVVGDKAKLECSVPGPTRFWQQEFQGEAPTAELLLSWRDGHRVPEQLSVSVDPELLEAGDHNGSTYYQHVKFRDAVLSGKSPEVSVMDGLKAVVIGMAAQESITTGKAMTITESGYSFES